MRIVWELRKDDETYEFLTKELAVAHLQNLIRSSKRPKLQRISPGHYFYLHRGLSQSITYYIERMVCE